MSTMIDYACVDSRSTKAWLSGKGDGRADAFAIFRKDALRRNPSVTEEEVANRYRDAIANGWLEKKGRKALIILAGCAIYAATAIIYVATL